MNISNGRFDCIQKDKRIKCVNCIFLSRCNKLDAIEEKIRQKKEEEEIKACKCFSCVWGHKETRYCPFPTCMKDELGR